MQESQKGFFDSMNPKASFVFGLVSGAVIIFLLSSVGVFSGGLALSGTSAAPDIDEAIAVVDTGSAPTAAAPSAGSVPSVTQDDHIRGDVDAPLTWIEYSDFECPFCKRFAPTMESMMEDYGDQIRLVYRHFPLSFHRPLALTQAEATECANEFKGNDAFWQMHDFIFETTSSNGNGMSEDELVEFATTLGINESDFQTCLDDDRYVDHIEEDLSSGSAAGVTGTPGSFFVDGGGNAQLISGAVPYSQIQAIIDAALK